MTKRNARTADEWAGTISQAWQDSVTGIFRIGNLLEAAREELGAAKFAAMVRDKLKYSRMTVYRLMEIAGDEKLRDVTHGLLPPSWRTLYELTKLTPEQFAAGLESGIIHAGMERKDIAELCPKKEKKKQSKSARIEPWTIDSVHVLVRSTALEAMDDLDRSQWPQLLSRLRDEVEQIERIMRERAANGSMGHNPKRESSSLAAS